MFCIFGRINRIIFIHAMTQPFDITQDRNFLQHFLTGWRVKSLSPEMEEIEKRWLKEYQKVDARRVPMDIRSHIRFR